MKANILIGKCIAFNKHIGSIYSRLDSLSLVSRQSVLAIVVACLTVFGVGNAWGTTTTYTFNSLSWGATSGGSAANWTSGKDANAFTSGKGVQVTSAKSGANATSPVSFSNVSQVKVIYNTNKTAGAGTIKIKIGSNSEVSTAVQYHSVEDGTSADYETTFRFEPRQSGSIKLTTDVTTNSIWIKEIEITYGNNASAYTISFNAGSGIYSGSDIPEGSANAGITLPNASPSVACAAEGWAFYGWATAQKTSSPTTAPEIVGKYGDKYYPTSSHTLYAVYASGEYTKITSSGDLTAGGKYLIASVDGGGQNYIMSNTYTWVAGWGQLDGRAISETNTTSHTYSAAATYTGDVFTVETTASLSIATGDWMVKNVHDGYYVSPDYMDFYLDIDGESPDGNTIAVNTGNWTITNAYNSSSNKVYFDATNHLFTLTTSTASNLLIYKETTTPNYSSTPSCCDYEVSVSESGSSHITSMAFSESSVPTCGDASSRTITITVTPASGYSLFGTTKPVFTKTSGTVTATIGSVTDNGDGTFSYECTFNSNDNGAGTFAISPGQFTNYRTLCCTKYDITLASSGSKTGGSFEVDPESACEGTEITLMATPDDGYEFSAWTITNDDDDDDDVTTTVLGSGNEDKDAIEFDMPAYNITIDAEFTCTEPTISVQPSGANYTQGDAATALSVTASAGTGSLDYQWQSSSDNSSWDDIDDETSSTYTPPTTSTGTMYYRVVVTNHECSESVESDAATVVVSAPSVCKTPTFSVSAGTYSSAQSVELSCGTGGATIRYTTNGDDPDGSSTAYSSAISVSVNTTIKAKAFKDGMTASSVASATYNIRCAAPTFSLSEDIYVGSQSLTMSSATTGATVRYTTDESEPTGSSTAYSSALTVGTSTTYKAKAYKDGMTESEESELYVMIQCATPTFSVSAGTYYANQSVSISTTYGTTIYYTLDGNDPTTKSSTYSSAITIDATKTLKAIAVKSGCEDSDVASATYTLKCATPTFSPVAGTYTGAQSVALSCATDGAAIHYTTNGTDPTGSSATYSSAISVGTNQTVKAIATKSGWSDSDVASAAYTIKYNVAVASVENVTISATTPSIAEGSSAVAAYGSTVSLSYSGVASGKTWGGWNVYKTGDASTTVTVTSNQFTMPAYNVTVTAFLFGDAIAWCDPDIEVTGDIHLTSYKDIPVNSTSGASNLISINSSDFGSATRLDVAYLDADNADAEVDKAVSVFRFCSSADYSTIDGMDLDYEWGTTHSIRYTPNAYNKRDNYKLQLILKRGDKVLKTVTKAIYGRALPEEFVIAVKNTSNNEWYALSNDLKSSYSEQSPIVPAQIFVDNTTTPTTATFASNATIYKGLARNAAGSNVNGIRLTASGTNKLSMVSDAAKMYLPTSNDDEKQVWYLKSSDFGAYEIAQDPSHSPTKKIGLYNNSGVYMGYAASPFSYNIYLLPVTNKYADIALGEETDWTGDAIGVTAEGADDVSATKMAVMLEGGSPTSSVTLGHPLETDLYAADFNGGIDFTGDSKGKTLFLKWYNSSDEMVGGSMVTVPSIVLAGSNDEWSDFASAPTMDDIVVLSKQMTVDDEHAQAKQIVMDKSGDNTGKLTIGPNKGLEVSGTVKVYNGTAFGATGEADLVLESSTAGNASLIFENAGNAATVQQYSKAGVTDYGTEDAVWNWQYVGTPFTGSIPLYNYYGSWMYKWYNGGWAVVKGNDVLTPFAGYCLTQESATTHVMGGTLVSTTDDVEVTMAASTDMVLANSWTAPIYIGGFTSSTFTSTPATIYLFNTGMAEKGSSAGTEAGTYVTVPVNAGPYSGDEFIAPMQGFFVTTNGVGGAEGTITMNYDALVRTAGNRDIVAGPMKAPKRAQAADDKPAVLKMWANGSEYNDRVVILAREDFSEGFDNGWDGEKLSFGAEAPSVYVINEQGGYDAVSAIPGFEGTLVGFRAGTNNTCTISFEYDGEEIWYLNDLQTQQSTLIDSELTYTFSTSSYDNEARFIISATPITKITTGMESVDQRPDVRKVLIEDKIYIIRGGRMYSTEGQMVK